MTLNTESNGTFRVKKWDASVIYPNRQSIAPRILIRFIAFWPRNKCEADQKADDLRSWFTNVAALQLYSTFIGH